MIAETPFPTDPDKQAGTRGADDGRPGMLHLPAGWSASRTEPGDVPALRDLLVRHEHAARGRSGTSLGDVEAEVVGARAARRRHRLVRDESGAVRGWATAWDRAAGRTVVSVVVDPAVDAGIADRASAALYALVAVEAAHVARERGLEATQLDAGTFAGDERQHRWLVAAGYQHVRTWWQMNRPVEPSEAERHSFPPPRPGVVVRLVEQEADGARPSEVDLRAVHDVLEEAFTDHFNYHEETFDEFVERLRENPGHRWDHWWVAELVGDDGSAEPAGTLVGEVSPGTEGKPDGSYVAYIGVLRSARGKGVGRSLLHAVIADAASRGRDRVGLEVDATSPTKAEQLYSSMGFGTTYVTESWHRDLSLA